MKKLGDRGQVLYETAKELKRTAGDLTEDAGVSELEALRRETVNFQKDITREIARLRRKA